MAFFQPKILNQLLADFPLVPVFYHENIPLTKSIIKACYDGGMRAFEFTNRGEKALEVFSAIYPFIRENCPEMALGIGTIFTVEQAKTFIDAGADFVVQPIITAEVGAYCQANEVAWFPGAATLNEIYTATQLGAEIVKIFPGNVVGPGFVKSIKGPMPNLKVMVTGGVEPTEESLKQWFSAGVTAVGMGSQLFPASLLASAKFDELSNNVESLMKYVRTLTAKK
jgi:2-dehydro-3-deoxyphosphogluconate aldolase / (4S)-4-hydroxy-2-oxoglutarate aldolase